MAELPVDGAPRVLLALPQFPHDPASGAARTATGICEMLRAAGMEVRSLATTVTEGCVPLDVDAWAARVGSAVVPSDGADGTRVLRYVHRAIEHTLLPGGRDRAGGRFDALFDAELRRFRPHALFTFGGSDGDLRRHLRARATGCRVVFGLFNLGYRSRATFRHVDHVVTPSEFLAARYLEALGLRSTPAPTPLHLDEVLAPRRCPCRVTLVNPSVEKGAFFVARLAEELGAAAPDVPLEVIESRGSGRLLVLAGFAGGFDLRLRENLLFRPSCWLPRDVYEHTRVLLVPSVVEEASARVVAEALVNGIPVIASDRGGVPENCAGGAVIHPLPADLTVHTRRPVAAQAVRPWVDSILSLFRDGDEYRRASARALRAGERFRPHVVAARYAALFRQIIAGTA